MSKQADAIFQKGFGLLIDSIPSPHLEEASAKIELRVVVGHGVKETLNGLEAGYGIEVATQGDIYSIGSRQPIDIDDGNRGRSVQQAVVVFCLDLPQMAPQPELLDGGSVRLDFIFRFCQTPGYSPDFCICCDKYSGEDLSSDRSSNPLWTEAALLLRGQWLEHSR